MLIKSLADRGTALAESIPHSLIALMARVAAGGGSGGPGIGFVSKASAFLAKRGYSRDRTKNGERLTWEKSSSARLPSR